MIKNKITAVLGPTNTGKTHLAIDTMLSFDSGMIGFPLRLLAREVYDKVIKKISGEHFKNYKINKVTRSDNAARVFYGGESEYFEYDKVVIATHADEALSIIDEPSDDEKDILSNFKYKKNLAVIHSDETVMPKKRINWSAWNTFVSENNDSSVTYWLNLLQNLDIEKNIFLTLNPHFNIDEKLVIDKIQFSHPYYDHDTLKNQKKLILNKRFQKFLNIGRLKF